MDSTQAQCSSAQLQAGFSPTGTGSASSGCSWRATGSAACGVLLPQGVSLTPPAIQDAQRSARPANTLTDRQTDRHSAGSPRESHRGGISQRKKYDGGKKNRRQKPQEKPHSAFPRALTSFSRQPHRMENAVPAPGPPAPHRAGHCHPKSLSTATMAKVPHPHLCPHWHCTGGTGRHGCTGVLPGHLFFVCLFPKVLISHCIAHFKHK